MGCEYHRNVTFPLEIIAGSCRTYPKAKPSKAFKTMDVLWFRIVEGIVQTTVAVNVAAQGEPENIVTVPAGSKVKLYDFQEKGKPETRSIIEKFPKKGNRVFAASIRKNESVPKPGKVWVFCATLMEVAA